MPVEYGFVDEVRKAGVSASHVKLYCRKAAFDADVITA